MLLRRPAAAGLPEGLGLLGRKASGGHDRDGIANHPLRHYKLMQRQQEGRTPIRESTLNLISCILGAGILGYPYCFKSCGTVLASVVMLLSLAACRFSYQLLLFCSQISSRRSYEELAEQALGSIGRKVVETCNGAINLGCMVAYLNILADVLSSVAGTIIPPGAEPSRSVYLAGVTIFGAFPMAMIVRDHQVVSAFAAASVGFMLLFTLVVMIFAAWPTPAASQALASGPLLWRADGLLVAFPVMAFGFTAHPYYLGVFQNMQAATVQRMATVTDLAMATSALVYWLVGMSGYLTFGSRTAGDVLRNFGAANVGGARGGYERIIKLCFGLSILGAVPLVILPFYNLVLPLFVGFDRDTAPGPTPRAESGRKHHASDTEDDTGRTKHVSQSPDSTFSGSSDSLRERDLRRSASGDEARPWPKVDVVDLKLHQDGVHAPHAAPSANEAFANPFLHAGVTTVVLGCAMAAAILIPNVEFIFGLTGATASVIISYILPALTFIRLLDTSPELSSGMHHQTKSGEYELQSKWLWRRRQAVVLLVFGIISGITCTDAILSAVKEEAVVVQLAQQLAAHEVVVAETTRAQAKAMEAVATVSAVTNAGKQLDAAQANATDTLGKLQEAAQQLDLISGNSKAAAGHGAEGDISGGEHGSSSGHAKGDSRGGKGGGIIAGIGGMVKQHQQHVAETKVLRHVAAALASVSQDVEKTYGSVAAVVKELDTTIQQLRVEEQGQSNASALVAAAAAAAAAGEGRQTDDGSEASKVDRVSSLAKELGNALGVYSNVAAVVTSGKSLEQVRYNAMSALQALNQTLSVLGDVSRALDAAQSSHLYKDSEAVKAVAARAMQVALNATATSALAMQLTSEALQRSANTETDELISVLTRVTGDLQKSKAKQRKEKAEREGKDKVVERIVVRPDGEADKVVDQMGSGTGSATQGEQQQPGQAGGAALAKPNTVLASPVATDAVVPVASPGQQGTGAGTATGSPSNSASPAGTGAATSGAAGVNATHGSSAQQQQQGIAVSKEKMDSLKKVIQDLQALTNSSEAEEEESRNQVATEQQAATQRPSVEAADSSVASKSLSSPTAGNSGTTAGTAEGSAHAKSPNALHYMPASPAAGTQQQQQQAGQARTEGDLADVKDALKDAVAWTEDSKKAAIKDIEAALSKANSKVQERVAGIVKDMKEAKEPVVAAATTSLGAADSTLGAASGEPGVNTKRATRTAEARSEPLSAGQPNHALNDSASKSGTSAQGTVPVTKEQGKDKGSAGAVSLGSPIGSPLASPTQSPVADVPLSRKLGLGGASQPS